MKVTSVPSGYFSLMNSAIFIAEYTDLCCPPVHPKLICRFSNPLPDNSSILMDTRDFIIPKI
jgi:hypothetical protein